MRTLVQDKMEDAYSTLFLPLITTQKIQIKFMKQLTEDSEK